MKTGSDGLIAVILHRPGPGVAPPMSSEASLLLAGVVIGLVIFISCLTIIIGRLRKGNSKRNPNLRSCSLVGDRYFVGSNGELRPIHPDESRTSSDWDSDSDLEPCSPPLYDECLDQTPPPMYQPAEAPPPYSLTDPHRWELLPHQPPQPIREQDSGRLTSFSLSALPLDEAPPYEAVVGGALNSPQDS